MEQDLFDLHVAAGRRAGVERTCGTKIAYSTEASAVRAAASMNAKPTTKKTLEGYPCAFCEKWHIGRQMSLEELRAEQAGGG